MRAAKSIELPTLNLEHRTTNIALRLLAVGSLLAALYLFLAFRVVPVNEDAGTFIPIAKEVLQGAVPTRDVMTWKTPGIYYIAGFWMRLFGTDFDRVVLLVYLVNALNAFLLYLVLSRFVTVRLPRLLLGLSFFYSSIILEGFWFVLEPFQVAFILAAYLAYLGKSEGFLKCAVTGLLVGCAVMVKQYSVFVLAGFLSAIWLERRKKDGVWAVGKKIVATALLSTLPFFAFVGLTGADMVAALRSFGVLGSASASYVAVGWSGPGRYVSGLLAGLVQANWLFLPFLLFLLLLLKRRGYFSPDVRLHISAGVLFLFSSLPLLVRQFNHYFLLVAPWSYILLGMLLGPALKEERGAGRAAGYAGAAGLLCLFVLLPAFVAATPSFYALPKGRIALFTSLFLLSALSLLFVADRLSGRRTGISAAVMGLCAVVFFETLFLGMKMPFRELRQQKAAQTAEAKAINAVFRRGSAVQVIGYHPYIYVTCDFVSPMHDYEFSNSSAPPGIDWERTKAVLIGTGGVPAYRSALAAHGLRKVGEWDGRVEFYEKTVSGKQ